MYQHCSHYTAGKVGESRAPELQCHKHSVLWSWGKCDSWRPTVDSSPSHSCSSWRARVSLAILGPKGDNQNLWWLRATEVKSWRDGCMSDLIASTVTLTTWVHYDGFILAVIRGKKALFHFTAFFLVEHMWQIKLSNLGTTSKRLESWVLLSSSHSSPLE